MVQRHEEFLAYMATVRSPNTALAYRKGVMKLVRFMNLRKVNFQTAPKNLLSDLAVYLVKQGNYQTNTIQLYFSSIRKYIEWLKDQGEEIKEFSKVELPRDRVKPPEIITQNIIEKYVAIVKKEIKEPYKTIFLILPHVGLRIDELCSLKISDIKEQKNIYYFEVLGKGNKIRNVPLSDECISILNNYFRTFHPRTLPSSPLFPVLFNCDRHVEQYTIRYYIRKIRIKLNAPWLTPHKLRHMFASMLVDKGVDIGLVAKLLGHSNTQTTLGYIHPSMSKMQEAVNKLGVNK